MAVTNVLPDRTGADGGDLSVCLFHLFIGYIVLVLKHPDLKRTFKSLVVKG